MLFLKINLVKLKQTHP